MRLPHASTWAFLCLGVGAAWLALALWLDVSAGWEWIRDRAASNLIAFWPVLVPVAIMMNGGALWCLGAALYPRWSGLAMMIAGVFAIVAGAVPTDPGHIETPTGWAHVLAATVALGAIVVAFALETLEGRRQAIWLTALSALALAHLGLVLLLRQFTSNPWLAALGLAERAVIGANMIGALALAVFIARRRFLKKRPVERP